MFELTMASCDRGFDPRDVNTPWRALSVGADQDIDPATSRLIAELLHDCGTGGSERDSAVDGR